MTRDFNTIDDINEKQGGLPVDLPRIEEFQDFIGQTTLSDIGFHGSTYTWCNNQRGRERIMQHLDRVMFNLDFRTMFPNTRVMHLPHVCFDHTPLCFQFQVADNKKPGGFIFQRIWLDHPSFFQAVKSNWESPIHGSPGHVFARKLISLRRTFKEWNWNTFGNIHRKKQGPWS